MQKSIIIVAPHEDDEIIGCFEILQEATNKNLQVQVMYPNSLTPPQHYCEVSALSFKVIIGRACWPFLFPTKVEKNIQFFFPDPVYETHPEHRRLGQIGEGLLRKGGDVVFYSVNMQAPYIREVKNPEQKKQALNLYYPEKSDLWRYDHKIGRAHV